MHVHYITCTYSTDAYTNAHTHVRCLYTHTSHTDVFSLRKTFSQFAVVFAMRVLIFHATKHRLLDSVTVYSLVSAHLQVMYM